MESYEHADEEYQNHLVEIKRKQEEKLKKEKEQCEQEYRRFNDQFSKSLGNYEMYIRQKQKQDSVTSSNLDNLEKRLNEGYTRHVQRKEEIRQSAANTLTKLEKAIITQKEHEKEIENERLMKYMERRQRYLLKIKKWEKERQKSLISIKTKNESKFGQAKLNLSDVQYDQDRMYQSILEKHDVLEAKISNVRQKREKEIQMRVEKESLKAQD